ncbi:Survival of motor neuron--splicing factor 30, partial [Xenoophorus captivus]
EVIDLTKDLLTSQPADGASSTSGSESVPVKLSWKVGDRCMAAWSQDSQRDLLTGFMKLRLRR